MRILSKRFSRLSREDHGATAIEYGLIAGLIALGIVGSLVATKGSLNSVLGLTSTQMGSATATPAAPTGLVFDANNVRSPYWAGKTVLSGPIHTSGTRTDSWETKFTDGSSATITIYKDAPLTYEVTREANTLYSIQTSYYNGVLDSVNATKYSDATWTNQTYAYLANSFDANNYPKSVVYGPCSGSSCSLPNSTTSPPALFVQQVRNGVADVAIFSANRPQ